MPTLTNKLLECKVVDKTYFYKKTNERLFGADKINKNKGKTEVNDSLVEYVKVSLQHRSKKG